MTDDNPILAAVASYYDDKLAAHGPTPRGVDWKDETSHQLRHAQFLRLLQPHPQASVLDLGCGYGDFLTFLRDAGHRGRYVGCDVSAEMIAAARERHAEGPDHSWIVGDRAPETCDFAIASGVMNVRCGAPENEWRDFVESVIDTLASQARRGFAFNMLSLASDPDKRRADLHYADPAEMLDYCLKRYGRHVAVLQDYGLWEFTVLVRQTEPAS